MMDGRISSPGAVKCIYYEITTIPIFRLSPVLPSNHSLTRDEVNLAEVVEDVAVQAIRGVQLEIR